MSVVKLLKAKLGRHACCGGAVVLLDSPKSIVCYGGINRFRAHFLDMCAGTGSRGQLGIALGNTSTVTIPVRVAATTGATSGWAAVSTGLGLHTCAIADTSGAAYCWGARSAAGGLSPVLLPYPHTALQVPFAPPWG